MKVFKMNDYNFIMAPSLEEATKFLLNDSDETEEDLEFAYELGEEELKAHTFYDDIDNRMESSKRTFREELDRRIKAGDSTDHFAFTEC